MSEQLTNGNGLLAASGELGQVPVDPIAEPNLSVLHQQHDRRCCGHDLSQGGHVKDCVRGHWLHQRFQSAVAEGFQVCNPPAPATSTTAPGVSLALIAARTASSMFFKFAGHSPTAAGAAWGSPLPLDPACPFRDGLCSVNKNSRVSPR